MDNAGLPEKPLKNQAASFDDIPEALRETAEVKPQPRSRWGVLLASGVTIVLGAGSWVAYQASQPRTTPATPNAATSASPSATPTPGILGHYPYSEAPEAELEPITEDGGIKMRASAARAYKDMAAAASAEGVLLVPISGFRSLSEQQQVFFDIKAERAQSLTQRAGVSAPPGYSEHHTGYAIDIGDGNVPATNLSPSFDQTPAFEWLQANAVRFNFEISFPKNNPQKVTYEPWHWRFVGDRSSLETFYKARGK